MADHSLELREAVVGALRASPAVGAFVPAERVYGEQPPGHPRWPFIRIGLPISRKLRSSGWSGGAHDVTVDGFISGQDDSHRLKRAIIETLDEAEVAIGGQGVLANLVWSETSDTLVIRDSGEADGYHVVVPFEAVTLEAVD